MSVEVSRRTFLRDAAIGAAALGVAGSGVVSAFADEAPAEGEEAAVAEGEEAAVEARRPLPKAKRPPRARAVAAVA